MQNWRRLYACVQHPQASRNFSMRFNCGASGAAGGQPEIEREKNTARQRHVADDARASRVRHFRHRCSRSPRKIAGATGVPSVRSKTGPLQRALSLHGGRPYCIRLANHSRNTIHANPESKFRDSLTRPQFVQSITLISLPLRHDSGLTFRLQQELCSVRSVQTPSARG